MSDLFDRINACPTCTDTRLCSVHRQLLDYMLPEHDDTDRWADYEPLRNTPPLRNSATGDLIHVIAHDVEMVT